MSVPLSSLSPNSLFRISGSAYRTGVLIQASTGSAKVEWHTLYQIVKKNGRNIPVMKVQGDFMIIAPGTMVQLIEEPVKDWGEVPTLQGVPLVRSAADLARLGWDIEGVKIVNNRPQAVKAPLV